MYFSHMFLKPEYKQENVEKEINAVHSEYVNSLNNDAFIALYFL
jgi:secreted Zn-dependent insulinase-like peptidase